MTETYENEQMEEKVILVGVSEQEGDDAEDSLAELAELVRTAGAVVVGTLIQKRESIHPGPYVDSVNPCHDSEAELEQEVRVRKNWKWIAV